MIEFLIFFIYGWGLNLSLLLHIENGPGVSGRPSGF